MPTFSCLKCHLCMHKKSSCIKTTETSFQQKHFKIKPSRTLNYNRMCSRGYKDQAFIRQTSWTSTERKFSLEQFHLQFAVNRFSDNVSSSSLFILQQNMLTASSPVAVKVSTKCLLKQFDKISKIFNNVFIMRHEKLLKAQQSASKLNGSWLCVVYNEIKLRTLPAASSACIQVKLLQFYESLWLVSFRVF